MSRLRQPSLDGRVARSGQYEACFDVKADPDVTLIGGDFTFRARHAVLLGEGFVVMGGATLAAEIDRAAGSGL